MFIWDRRRLICMLSPCSEARWLSKSLLKTLSVQIIGIISLINWLRHQSSLSRIYYICTILVLTSECKSCSIRWWVISSPRFTSETLFDNLLMHHINNGSTSIRRLPLILSCFLIIIETLHIEVDVSWLATKIILISTLIHNIRMRIKLICSSLGCSLLRLNSILISWEHLAFCFLLLRNRRS